MLEKLLAILQPDSNPEQKEYYEMTTKKLFEEVKEWLKHFLNRDEADRALVRRVREGSIEINSADP